MIRVQISISEDIEGEEVFTELSFHIPIGKRQLAEDILDKANAVRVSLAAEPATGENK